MGATGWSYIVPYRPDMNQVLEDLRSDVFRRGAYHKPAIDLGVLEEMGFFEADEEDRDQMIGEYGLEALRAPLARYGLDGLRGWLEALDGAPAVGSRDELEALQCLTWEGTGSILDIATVQAEPSAACLSPLLPQRLRRLFESEQPGREMLERLRQRGHSLRDEYERGQGIYFVLYKEGRPDEIYIEGASGD